MRWTGKARNTKQTAFGAYGWLAFGIIGASLLAGCGGSGGGDGDSQSAEELLPGVWRATRLDWEGKSTACAGAITVTKDGVDTSVSCGANDTVTFYENHAFTAVRVGAGAYAGTWQLSGNALTITITDPSSSARTATERVDFSGDNKFKATEESGTNVTFERQ